MFSAFFVHPDIHKYSTLKKKVASISQWLSTPPSHKNIVTSGSKNPQNQDGDDQKLTSSL